MKLDWNRIKRTVIQSLTGAGVALVTAISTDMGKKAIITAVVTFVCTILTAVLMNIQKQVEEQDEEDKDENSD